MSITFTDNAIPRYLQIADLMRQRIARGQWPKEQKLPSLESLVTEFGVARVTVRQAIDLLAREGLVSPQQGRGTFVTGQPARRQWLKVQTSVATLAQAYKDDKPELMMINEAIALAPLRPDDGKPAERYVFMRRVHSRDGQPYCVADLYLDEKIFSKHPQRFRNETVIPVLHAMKDRRIARAHQVLTIATADMEIARLLRAPVNAPIAEVRRVFVDAENRVIYLGEITYRGDFISLDMDLKA